MTGTTTPSAATRADHAQNRMGGGQVIIHKSWPAPASAIASRSPNWRLPSSQGLGSLNRSAASEPAIRDSPLNAVGRTRSRGETAPESSRMAAMVSRGSRSSATSGPSSPCVRLAWPSTSTSRIFRPRRASVPARWWTVDVLPTPPFRFRNAIVRGTWQALHSLLIRRESSGVSIGDSPRITSDQWYVDGGRRRDDSRRIIAERGIPMCDRNAFPPTEESIVRLRRSGWSTDETTCHAGGGIVYQVDGSNGENRIGAVEAAA